VEVRAFPVRLPSSATYWTVLDDDLEVMAAADGYLRHLRRARRLAEPGVDFAAWCATANPVATGLSVTLRGLPPLVQAELLYGLQARCRRGSKTALDDVRSLARRLRDARAASVAEFDPGPARRARFRQLAADIQASVAGAVSSPELERHRDVWRMGVFGPHGSRTIDFTKLTQPWLRAAAKHWVREELPTRRGPDAAVTLRDHVNALAQLSDSLRESRADQGLDPAALGRDDIVGFLNRLGHLEGAGKLSAQRRPIVCRMVAKLLRECRALGLTRPGQPMAGLPDDFALRRDDMPALTDRDGPGRALPQAVLRQLVDALPQLEARSGREVRVAVTLLMDTGRRPDEVCQLPWDCLEQDADGKHTLVYTDFKADRAGRRLPVSDATATLIADQQQRIRGRFPATPLGELVLLPRPTCNPDGTRSLRDYLLADAHRAWVDALPPLRLDDEQQTEFDKAKVVPYAYRHSFAQRHADAGTPVDELRELMSHRSMTTTQGYYRVTAKRLAARSTSWPPSTSTANGNRVWHQARALVDSEHQRLAVGRVAVPFGTCSEPSNVQAGGGACPFRFRCLGCAHFRSDPSYLPELRLSRHAAA
jgi:integrase